MADYIGWLTFTFMHKHNDPGRPTMQQGKKNSNKYYGQKHIQKKLNEKENVKGKSTRIRMLTREKKKNNEK